MIIADFIVTNLVYRSTLPVRIRAVFHVIIPPQIRGMSPTVGHIPSGRLRPLANLLSKTWHEQKFLCPADAPGSAPTPGLLHDRLHGGLPVHPLATGRPPGLSPALGRLSCRLQPLAKLPRRP